MSASYEIDLTTVQDIEVYQINLPSSFYKEIAQRFKIPEIYIISIEAQIIPHHDIWQLAGHVDADVQLKCTQSQELFEARFHASFEVVLSYHEIDDDMMDVEILETSKVDISEIALQYLALEIPINPIHPQFTKQTAEFFVGRDKEVPEWKRTLERLKTQK
jgi:uncharacterized metal-binding protein YceD (DUF177 family)